MESLWIITLTGLAASVGSLLALRPTEEERSPLFFLIIAAGLAGFPIFALGHSLGWWSRVPIGGWAANPVVATLPGEHRRPLLESDCLDGANLESRLGPHGTVQDCRKAGLRHGPHRAWRYDGILAVDCNWHGGKIHGPCERWYHRGRNRVAQLHAGNWKRGIREGLHVDRFRTGRTHYEAFFWDGRPRGQVTIRGPASQVLGRFHFDAHGPTGRWLRWHLRSGRVLSDGQFTRGQPTGEWRLLDSQTGRPWVQLAFSDGKLHGPYREWDVRARVRLEADYENGQLHGPYKLFHEGGERWLEGSMKRGEPSGEWLMFDRAGRQLESCEYPQAGDKPFNWCFGRGPWATHHDLMTLLLGQYVEWYRAATGPVADRPLDAYPFDYGFPDWSP